jgi:23S rRNA (guanosine2251-2'-O)-methyltransferase
MLRGAAGATRIRGELLWGLHACAAAVAANVRVVHRAWLDVDAGSRAAGSLPPPSSSARAEMVSALASRGVPITRAAREVLAALVARGGAGGGGARASADAIQGVVLDASLLNVDHVVVGAPPPLWAGARRTAGGGGGGARLLLALDGLSDPHNVGAVLRSALLLQADGVLLSAKGCAPLGATVSRTSAGALEALAATGALRLAAALPASLATYRAAGWRVLGADAAADDGGGAASAAGAAPALLADALARTCDTVLVMGSEGAGMRAAVRAACSGVVAIPTAGGGALLDSLNVSNAAAVLLWQLRPLPALTRPAT